MNKELKKEMKSDVKWLVFILLPLIICLIPLLVLNSFSEVVVVGEIDCFDIYKNKIVGLSCDETTTLIFDSKIPEYFSIVFSLFCFGWFFTRIFRYFRGDYYE